MGVNEDSVVKKIKSISRLMDSKFEGPMGIRFGLDAILGFIPGVGDLITTAISFYIIFQAGSLGCSPVVLIRMLGNIVFENIIDLIPGIGNFVDIFWRSNDKNVALLEEHLSHPEFVKRKSGLILALVGLVLLALVSISIYFTISIFQYVLNLFLVLK